MKLWFLLSAANSPRVGSMLCWTTYGAIRRRACWRRSRRRDCGTQHCASASYKSGPARGTTIALPAATLRSTGLELVGSGFGSVSIEKIFKEAAKEPFQIKIGTAPLRDVEALWTAPEQHTRLVFSTLITVATETLCRTQQGHRQNLLLSEARGAPGSHQRTWDDDGWFPLLSLKGATAFASAPPCHRQW